MATTVSAWTKPGAWALDSEEHEEELVKQQQEKEKEKETEGQKGNFMDFPALNQQPLSDFPSLSAAVTTKAKKKKPQTLSLSEFATGKSVSHGSAKSAQIGLTPDELMVLPTGPRERSAEELERSSGRLGGGFRSYGSGDGGRGGMGRDRGGEERRERREPRESGPSRADETDDWGAAKKSISGFGSGFERRERGSGGGFFDSQSRADDSDNWGAKKSFVPSEPRRGGGGGFDRERRGGFEFTNGGGADSETWGRKRDNGVGGDSDNWGRKRDNGGDSETWGKKREEGIVNERPKLVLQPRTVPVNSEELQRPGSGSGSRSKGSNPFGAARPREEVLAEKGQDWKKIDEQLESVKIKEKELSASGSFGRRGFGNGDGNGRMSSPENRTERSWKSGNGNGRMSSFENRTEKSWRNDNGRMSSPEEKIEGSLENGNGNDSRPRTPKEGTFADPPSPRSSIQQEIASAKQRIFFIDKRSPELEAEKKVAAAARNFKEAGRIAAEAKTLGVEKESLQIKMGADVVQLAKMEEQINDTITKLNETEELILIKEKEAAMAGCERQLLVAAAAKAERSAALELGDLEEANTLEVEAEAADFEATKIQQAYDLKDKEFESSTKHLISMELIANLGGEQLAKMASSLSLSTV